MIIIKRDFEKIISKHKSFINLKNTDQPLLCIWVLGTDYAAEYKETFKNIPNNREIEPEDISLNDYVKDVEKFILWHEEVGEDYFYPVCPYLIYIPWTEAVIGCPIYPEKDSIFAKPFIKNWDNFNWEIDLSEGNKWLNKLLNMNKALVEYFGDKYPITSSPHLRGPADMMSAGLGATRLPMEMYDNPEKIKKLSHICTDIFIKIAKKLNEIAAKAKFGGYITPIYGIWTKDVCQYYQDDATALLSPKFYKEFILDNELKIDRSFNSTIFSVHGNNMYIIDELLNFPSIKILQTHREPKNTGPTIKEMVPVFKNIQKHKKALIINFTDIDYNIDLLEEETELIFKELSYNGLCIFICVKDLKDGKEKSQAIKGVLKKLKSFKSNSFKCKL